MHYRLENGVKGKATSYLYFIVSVSFKLFTKRLRNCSYFMQ